MLLTAWGFIGCLFVKRLGCLYFFLKGDGGGRNGVWSEILARKRRGVN